MTGRENTPIERVLVVEDDRSVRSLLSETLAMEGYYVDAAPALQEGRDLLAGDEYGVVIIDLKLPDGSGMDLVRDARERSETARIVVMTGFREDILRRRAQALGANGFLSKPFDPQDLLDAISGPIEAHG